MFELNNFVTAVKFFLIISGELVLIFLAVSFVVGILMEYLPPSRIRDFLSNRLTWIQYLLGSGLGAITPFCSCSTVPITVGLLKGGVPFGPVMAFLFASPVLNPIIITLLLSLFGLKVTGVYVFTTFIGSMVLAAIISKMGMENQVKPLMSFQTGSCCGESPKAQKVPVKMQPVIVGCCASEAAQPLVTFPVFQPSKGCCATDEKAVPQPSVQASCCSVDFEADVEAGTRASFKEKMKRASLSAVDTFKGVFLYLLIGAGIGAFIYGFFPQDLVIKVAGPGNPWSIPIAAIIGIPMYIRAETIIPISAALVGKGMGLGTVLALIIGGAGASIPELIILNSIFKKKLVLAFAINVFVVAVVAGYFVEWLIY
ncbi:MAG TPA: permease [Syntrophorhabdaceae bacterium]|nr:permease [Syntrophorhabdaceae bacterium]HRV23426.1 permease [Syntrophorhabdaceae bacterium]